MSITFKKKRGMIIVTHAGMRENDDDKDDDDEHERMAMTMTMERRKWSSHHDMTT